MALTMRFVPGGNRNEVDEWNNETRVQKQIGFCRVRRLIQHTQKDRLGAAVEGITLSKLPTSDTHEFRRNDK